METSTVGDSEILAPKKVIAVGGCKVEVRELAWPKALEFLKALGEEFTKSFEQTNGDGSPPATIEGITKLITGSQRLSEMLIVNATGLKPEQLSVSQAMDVLEAALELNLSDDLIARGKRFADSLRDRFAKVTPAAVRNGSAKSTSSSLGTGTRARS